MTRVGNGGKERSLGQIQILGLIVSTIRLR